MKNHKGKKYSWVNQVLRSDVYATLWRQADDPRVCILDTKDKKDKDAKTEELKVKAKDKWKEVTDKPKVKIK